jgi:hypothetical protein
MQRPVHSPLGASALAITCLFVACDVDQAGLRNASSGSTPSSNPAPADPGTTPPPVKDPGYVPPPPAPAPTPPTPTPPPAPDPMVPPAVPMPAPTPAPPPAQPGPGGLVPPVPPAGTMPPTPTPTPTPPAGPVPGECDITTRPVRFSAQDATEGGDLTFDGEGYLVMADGRDLVRLARGNPPIPLVQNALRPGRSLFGVRVLEDGTVFVTDNSTDIVFRIDASGVRRMFTMDRPVQFVRGPGGGLYVTGIGGELFYLDMQTERSRVLTRVGGSLRGITFSPDYKTIYVSDRSNGSVLSLDLRADGSVGQSRVLTRNLGSAPDGLATDICGNVYVADRTGDALMRVTPAGRVETVVDVGSPLSGLAFGSGKQGWDDHALYAVSESRGRLYEIRLGVRGAALWTSSAD